MAEKDQEANREFLSRAEILKPFCPHGKNNPPPKHTKLIFSLSTYGRKTSGSNQDGHCGSKLGVW
jgi:hypothetical protein